MARHTIASSNSRHRPGCARGRAFNGTKIPADFERRCFEYDRKLVAVVIERLEAAIGQTAAQMDMVAEQQIYDESLSATFARIAQRFHWMTHELNDLMAEVGDAEGYPKMPRDQATTAAVVRPLPPR